MVLNDNVGRRLTISPATTTAHTPTGTGEDHQPSPKCSVAYSGRPETSAAAGAGTPTKNSLAYGGWSSTSISVLNRASRSAMHTANTSATTQPSRRALQRPDVEDERGRDAERDEVRQRVQLGADPAAGVEHPGEAAVQRVAQGGDPAAATHSSNRPDSAKYTADSPEHSATTVTAFGSSRTPAGHQDRTRAASSPGSVASTVSPPIVRCPGATATREPAGRYTSTRDPKRINP